MLRLLADIGQSYESLKSLSGKPYYWVYFEIVIIIIQRFYFVRKKQTCLFSIIKFNTWQALKLFSRGHHIIWRWLLYETSLVAELFKESVCNAGDLGSTPGLGRSPEKGMATHSSILAWRIPWRQSMGSQRVRHDWVTNTFTLIGQLNSKNLIHNYAYNRCYIRHLSYHEKSAQPTSPKNLWSRETRVPKLGSNISNINSLHF